MSIHDVAQCTAQSKSSGDRCRQPAVKGFSVCRFHGAGSPKRGRAGGRPIVTGRYSKRLPERLASRYREALNDAKLLELRDEVALLDTRLAELLGAIDTGESGARWKAVKAAHDDVRQAIRQHDSGTLNTALVALAAAIEGGLMEQFVWSEIYGLVDARRRLVESERKRYVEMQQMITAERAMILLGAITAIIKENVHDRLALAAISDGIRGLISQPTGAETDA